MLASGLISQLPDTAAATAEGLTVDDPRAHP
jgi:hypothetical protein